MTLTTVLGTDQELPTNCGTCGTTTTEPTCPKCGATVSASLPADPFSSDPFTPATPPAANPPTPPPPSPSAPSSSSPSTVTGRGPVTGRPAGSGVLPRKKAAPIKEIAGGVALLIFLTVIGIGLFPRILGGFSNLPAINDFAAGTCFVVEGSGTFSDTPCSVPHDGEVVGSGDWTGADDYPGAAQLEDWANIVCIDQFTAFVGVDPEGSELDLGILYPSPSSWDEGDRRAICAVQFLDLPATGSVAASGG